MGYPIMKEISWDEYYDKFYEWSESTQRNRAYGLTSYGPADEVFEVAMEFAFHDNKFASRFVNRALDAGVHFTPEQAIDATLVDKGTQTRMAETAMPAFTREQLEDIYLLIDDAAFERISKKTGIDIFADDEESIEGTDDNGREYDYGIEYYEPPEPKPPKIGFFTKLMAVMGAASAVDAMTSPKHSGRCNGDCAHCPPHYGYRYGRWYYGHGHQYGCEFGGNKGDGSL